MANETIITNINQGNPIYADADPVTFTIGLQVKNASYTHTIHFYLNATQAFNFGNIGSFPVGYTTYRITLTSEQRTTLLNYFTNVASYRATIYVETYTVGLEPLVGQSYMEMERGCRLSSEARPTLGDFTYADTNASSVALTGNNQELIQGVSSVTFSNLSSSAKLGGTISGYEAVVGSGTYAKSIGNASATTGVYGTYEPKLDPLPSTDSVSVVVKDTRGLQTWKTVEATVYAYQDPSLTEYSIKRAPLDRSKINIYLKGVYSPILTNTITLKFRYKEVGGSFGSYVTVTPTISNDTFTYSASNYGSFDVNTNYEFEVVVSDSLRSNAVSIIVPTRDILVSFRDKAIGIGKEPSSTNVVDISHAYSLHANGQNNTAGTMPYSFSTNGGQTFSTQADYPGYARIARITFTSIPSEWVYRSLRFKLQSTRWEDINLYAQIAAGDDGNGNLLAYIYLWYAMEEGQDTGNPTSTISMFAVQVSDGVYDFYSLLLNTNDKITVFTYADEALLSYIDISYEDGFTTSLPSSGVVFMAEQGAQIYPFLSVGKGNRFTYMPYSAVFNNPTATYLQIARIEITGTWADEVIEFEVFRRQDRVPHRLYLRFGAANNTTPGILSFYYDTAYSANTAFEAWAYTIGSYAYVYVSRAFSSDSVTVVANVPPYMQDRIKLTFPSGTAASISSGAVVAAAAPLDCWAKGETYSATRSLLSGVITSSSKQLKFGWQSPKNMDNISTITVTAMQGTLRGNQGYIDNDSSIRDLTTLGTLTCYKRSSWDVEITLDVTTAFTNVTNNTPINFYANTSFVLTFT